MEYMTLYERDKEKIQEGVEIGIEKDKLENAKSLLDILDDEIIATNIGLEIEVVQELGKNRGMEL